MEPPARPACLCAIPLWSLNKLPMNAADEWTLSEKCERVRAAGFAGIECWLTDESEAAHKAALDAQGLELTLGHHPHTLEDVRQTVARAVRLNADFVFAQPLTPYVPIPEAAKFLREARKIANDAGKCLFVETHRNNIPESLNQALQLIEAYPEVRFTGDLSHFVVVGEFYGWESEGALERMQPVLSRISHLHGRISNGEAVQVDVGDGTGDTARSSSCGCGRRLCRLGARRPCPVMYFPSRRNWGRPATPSPSPTDASSATAGNKVL